MPFHVIVGRGATASATALLLADAGDTVRMVSRSGEGPAHPLVERTALDATDTAALTRLADGAATVFNTAAAAYHLWPELLPSLFGSIQTAAERSGAGYVMLGNLYGYGPPTTPSMRTTPSTRPGRRGGCAPTCGSGPRRRTTPGGCGPPRSAPASSSAPAPTPTSRCARRRPRAAPGHDQ
ncbi:hypothetical protein [Actinomadura madurae]|uniref:hypothetical protein n=1 Tax=Actinomadura madurae TaxID=1993 RepID=UPI0020D23486|nr:hypothetical protein [Actinomadura madurae]MCQ0010027.1 hypothetical protein [Actinomadura madurae]